MTATLQMPPMIIGGAEARPDRPRRVYRSPGGGQAMTEILLGNADDVEAAVAAAHSGAATMAEMEPDERQRRCLVTAAAIQGRSEELARILSREHGKPVHAEALGELLGCADAFLQAGGQARWMPASHYALSNPDKRILATRRPRGVYGVITPWNFPVGLACMYYLAPGLAAGNAIVWLGAPSTNAVQGELAGIVAKQWPAGALNFITGEGAQVGQALITHPGVDAVGFTGSTATGQLVARAAAGKPCMLELGGNGPTIVLADADIELAAERIARGTYTNAGQICTATGRILAQRSVAGALAEALAQRADQIVLGNPEDEETTMGPVHLESLAQRVVGQITDAVDRGAQIITGGRIRPDMPTDQFVEATVVDGVSPEAPLHREETFGPVAPIISFGSAAEMWRLSAASPYGLHAAIFSRDVEHAVSIAEKLRFGHVNLNDTSAYWEPAIPAGGATGTPSGIGRTGGPWSVQEMTELFTITMQVGSRD